MRQLLLWLLTLTTVLAWAVLTDFEHMGSIVPNLTSSQVMERRDTTLSVKQKGVVRHETAEQFSALLAHGAPALRRELKAKKLQR